jgi:predicted XRE-type DNA-binding protein
MNDIEKSTGNIYEDLGCEASREMLVKAQLTMTIKELIVSKAMTQMQASEVIGLPQPKLSRLLNGEVRGVSVAKMLEVIVALGRDVQIVIGPERLITGQPVSGRFEVVQH